MTVKVQEKLGACAAAKCCFTYVAPLPVVTSYTIAPDYSGIVMNGLNFDQLNYQYIRFAGYEATVTSFSATKIEVSISKVEAGGFLPEIYIEGVGFLPMAENLPKIYIQAPIVEHTPKVF